MLHRGFHKIERTLICDLVKKESGILIGRICGTEKWVACKLEHLIIEHHSQTYDVNHTPIFEEDILRDKKNNRYRVIYQGSNGLEWSLYHIESRTYFPLIETQRYEVIGNRHIPLTATEPLLTREFRELPVVLHGDVEIETQPVKKVEGKSSVSEIMNEGKPSEMALMGAEASLIPSFLQRTRETRRVQGLKKKQSVFRF